jgi:hypothetical protein
MNSYARFTVVQRVLSTRTGCIFSDKVQLRRTSHISAGSLRLPFLPVTIYRCVLFFLLLGSFDKNDDMGWYHLEITNNGDVDPTNITTCPEGTCHLPPPDESREQSAREELYHGNGPIFHLCQKSKWMDAIRNKGGYFPPTFWSDGRFTRASCVQDTLMRTANHYYKQVSGDWLCIEMDPALLRQSGIAIAVQRAPESTTTDPIQCLKLYGGIPVIVTGLVTQIYAMQRNSDGTFLGMLPDDGVDRVVVRAKETRANKPSQPKKSEPCGCNVKGESSPKTTKKKSPKQSATKTEQVKEPRRRGFWRRKK